MQACHLCGIGFEMEFVPNNPFKKCPNPACGAPLDTNAVEHTFVEAGNPSDVRDTRRTAQREQLFADVSRHTEAAARAGAPGDRPGVTREELDAAVAGVVKSLPGMVDAAVAASAAKAAGTAETAAPAGSPS